MRTLPLLALAGSLAALGCHRSAHPSLSCPDQVKLAPAAGTLFPDDAIVVAEWGPGRLGLWKPKRAGLALRVDGVQVPVVLEAFTDLALSAQSVRLTPKAPLPVGARVVLEALEPNVKVNPFSVLPESARSWVVQARTATPPPGWTGPPEVELPRPTLWARWTEPPVHGGTLRLPLAGELGALHVRLRLTEADGTVHELVVPAAREFPIGASGCPGTFALREGARYTLAAWVGAAAGPEVPAPSTVGFEGN